MHTSENEAVELRNIQQFIEPNRKRKPKIFEMREEGLKEL
jgi:hypothetical protein